MSPDNLNTDRQADVTRWLIPATGWSQDHQLNSPVCFCRQTDRQTDRRTMFWWVQQVMPACLVSCCLITVISTLYIHNVWECARGRTLPANAHNCACLHCICSYWISHTSVVSIHIFFIYVYQCYLGYVRCGKCTALCRAIKISFIFWHRLTCIVNTLFVHAHHNKS